MKKSPIPEAALEFFRKKGAEGGKSRAARHSKKQLSEWAKLGGRPKATRRKETVRQTTAKKGGK
jgi:hypothetical protein